MKNIEIKLTNNKIINCEIKQLEYILGMTALMTSNVIDKNVKAINPITKEEVKIIKGNVNKIICPAHDEQDYKMAKKEGLEIRQVIAPYFGGEEKQKIRLDKELQKRRSVIVIVANKEKDKVLCMDGNNTNTRSFVMGGIEKGESPSEAAIREVKEETGYNDINVEFVSNYKVVRHFYADYKGVNRYAYLNIIFATLNTYRKINVDDKEKEKHLARWIDKIDVLDFINVENNKFAFEMYLHGENAYIGDGRIVDVPNAEKYEEMTNIEARKKIEEILYQRER